MSCAIQTSLNLIRFWTVLYWMRNVPKACIKWPVLRIEPQTFDFGSWSEMFDSEYIVFSDPILPSLFCHNDQPPWNLLYNWSYLPHHVKYWPTYLPHLVKYCPTYLPPPGWVSTTYLSQPPWVVRFVVVHLCSICFSVCVSQDTVVDEDVYDEVDNTEGECPAPP